MITKNKKTTDYDLLDNELDVDNMKFKKNPFAKKFTLKDKINLCIDTLFEDSKISKNSFYKQFEKQLKVFCYD